MSIDRESREFKDRLFEQFSLIGKALAAPKRIELIDILCQAERTVEALAKEASMTVANTSRHLQVLRNACLVETRREGNSIYYRIADDSVCKLWLILRDLALKRIAEVDRLIETFFKARDELEPLNREQLLERAKTAQVIVLDVRPREEYLAGHIPGAISIPVDELESRLNELPRDVEIVAYCRGPCCVFSLRAVEILRARGYRALRLREGVRDWLASGLPVSVGGEA